MQADGPEPVQLRLYPLQLRDLVLWQLDVKRADQPVQVQETDRPDMAWKVEITPLADVPGSSAAKLSLDYRFPGGETTAYTTHVELVGLFVPVNIPEDDTKPTPSSALTASEKSPEGLLDLNIVTSLMWPYLRELVHQLQLRMRVPLFLLPTLDVREIQGVEEENTKQG